MKIHISSFALFFWGFILLIAGLTSDIILICLAAMGFCVAMYWHISHFTYDTDTIKQIEELRKKISVQPNEWFKKGQNSIKRKNKSGCCCIIDDDDEIKSLCGAHEQYVEELRDLMHEVSSADFFIRYNSDFNERWKKALGV